MLDWEVLHFISTLHSPATAQRGQVISQHYAATLEPTTFQPHPPIAIFNAQQVSKAFLSDWKVFLCFQFQLLKWGAFGVLLNDIDVWFRGMSPTAGSSEPITTSKALDGTVHTEMFIEGSEQILTVNLYWNLPSSMLLPLFYSPSPPPSHTCLIHTDRITGPDSLWWGGEKKEPEKGQRDPGANLSLSHTWKRLRPYAEYRELESKQNQTWSRGGTSF